MTTIVHPESVEGKAVYSRVRLAAFYGCGCDPDLMMGSRALQMVEMLVEEANVADLCVVNTPTIEYFGDTAAEKLQYGTTINVTLGMKPIKKVKLQLEASGVSFDFWNKGRFTTSDGNTFYGTVHMNLQYCNKDHPYDDQAHAFEVGLEQRVFKAQHVKRLGPFDLDVDMIAP